MKTRYWLGMTLCTLGIAQAYAQQRRQPHIILLMTDQQRFDALHCAGNEAVYSPHLDRLAADGNLFFSGYSSCPSSTPARAGLVTGMSPWNHGMLGYGNEAEHYAHEFPREMKKLGYYTVGIGKMHWYPQWNTRGLDILLSDESGREQSPDYKSDYRKWFALHAGGLNPDTTGISWNDHRARTYQLPEELHPTTWTGQTAVDFIRNYQGTKPLFLKVSFARPHSPYDPPRRIMDMYQTMPQPSAPVIGDWVPDEWQQLQDGEAAKEPALGFFGDDFARRSRRHYYASVTFIDEQIGRIVEELKKRDIYDNALIFFVSDHGDMVGDHCMWRKTYAYEGSSHIPFIVKLPKGQPSAYAPGEVVKGKVVELRDVLPTAIDVAHGTQPEVMDGKSLLPLLADKQSEWRQYLDLEHTSCYLPNSSWCALTDSHMKYIYFYNTGEEQFFDLEADPLETKNLIANKKYRKHIEAFREAMIQHLSVRGVKWVKDGELQIIKGRTMYGPNFPYEGDPYKRPWI